MDEYKYISRYEIEEKLTGENFKINRIIGFALFTGPFILLLVVVYLYQQKEGGLSEQQSTDFIQIMLTVFLIMAASIYLLVAVLPKIFLSKENLVKMLSSTFVKKQDEKNSSVIKLILVDRTLMIIRLAMMEGVTLFGLVIMMLSVFNSVIYTNESYFLLVLPWIAQLIFTINNYFNKDKVVERIYNEILSVVTS